MNVKKRTITIITAISALAFAVSGFSSGKTESPLAGLKLAFFSQEPMQDELKKAGISEEDMAKEIEAKAASLGIKKISFGQLGPGVNPSILTAGLTADTATQTKGFTVCCTLTLRKPVTVGQKKEFLLAIA